ncbi:DNA-binding NtrC family response regulator [Paraburkholderia sp. GAS448]|uniref:sigma-54 dependent transcriptional regulator n=1 Tax=Paraburkholderia sp. GAS448 TaxID=3035136 RepID=UPI003D1DC11E
MSGMGRRLYHVCRSEAAFVHTQFQDRAWIFDQIDVRKWRKHSRRLERDAGGLLEFSSLKLPDDLPELAQFLRGSGVPWVAVLEPGHLESGDIRQLVRNECLSFVTLPSSSERLAHAVGHACGMAALWRAASNDVGTGDCEDELVGNSDSMHALFRAIRKIATSDAPVYISGETGTGKELTAKAIHKRSSRRDRAFVAVNCGAIPPHLFQSELFGYERGAFTGAVQRKIGRVEAAQAGTLFLDEIGDLPFESQASLLRFLQEQKIERLGGEGSIDVDVRVICATHVDLEQAISAGRFRRDLYHRLCVLQLDEPPLRDRADDIELLAHHALERYRNDATRRVRGFSSCALAALGAYHWPGNVRELMNRVRRAIVMSDGTVITAADLGFDSGPDVRTRSISYAREEAERRAIEIALLRNGARLADAATDLGVSRVTLYRLLRAYGFERTGLETGTGE